MDLVDIGARFQVQIDMQIDVATPSTVLLGFPSGARRYKRNKLIRSNRSAGNDAGFYEVLKAFGTYEAGRYILNLTVSRAPRIKDFGYLKASIAEPNINGFRTALDNLLFLKIDAQSAEQSR